MPADTTERALQSESPDAITAEVAAIVEATVERLAGAFRLQCDRTRAELEQAREDNLRLQTELQAMRDRVRALESEIANNQTIRAPQDAVSGRAPEPSLQVVSANRESGAAADQRLVEYTAHLFEHIQSIYKADVEEMNDRSLVVERLAANLRHARAAFGRRLEACGSSDWSAFDQYLAQLLDSESPQNAFGRHLAIAAYAYLAPVRAEAS
jgi:hypothetical protein